MSRQTHVNKSVYGQKTIVPIRKVRLSNITLRSSIDSKPNKLTSKLARQQNP